MVPLELVESSRPPTDITSGPEVQKIAKIQTVRKLGRFPSQTPDFENFENFCREVSIW